MAYIDVKALQGYVSPKMLDYLSGKDRNTLDFSTAVATELIKLLPKCLVYTSRKTSIESHIRWMFYALFLVGLPIRIDFLQDLVALYLYTCGGTSHSSNTHLTSSLSKILELDTATNLSEPFYHMLKLMPSGSRPRKFDRKLIESLCTPSTCAILAAQMPHANYTLSLRAPIKLSSMFGALSTTSTLYTLPDNGYLFPSEKLEVCGRLEEKIDDNDPF